MTEPRRRDVNRRLPYDGAPGGPARPRQRDAGPNGDPRRRPSSPEDAYRLPRAPRDELSRQSPPRGEHPRHRDTYPARASSAEGRRPKPPSGRPRRLWGALPGRTGVCLVVGSAAVGALLTALARREPGVVLGVLLVAGTLVATLAVKPRAVYRIIPVPALSYLVAAVLAGMIHDRANGTSSTALAVGATQWIASGFVAMTTATILAIVIAVVRWGTSRGPVDDTADGLPTSADGPPTSADGSARRAPAPRTRPRDEDGYHRDYRASAAMRPPRDGQRRA